MATKKIHFTCEVYCPCPKFWVSRWNHRLWICQCGKAWRTRFYGAAGYSFWGWEEWIDNSMEHK